MRSLLLPSNTTHWSRKREGKTELWLLAVFKVIYVHGIALWLFSRWILAEIVCRWSFFSFLAHDLAKPKKQKQNRLKNQLNSIFISVCLCVCVGVCGWVSKRERERERERERIVNGNSDINLLFFPCLNIKTFIFCSIVWSGFVSFVCEHRQSRVSVFLSTC